MARTGGFRRCDAGRIIVEFLESALWDWEQAVAMARAVQRNEVPPLRVDLPPLFLALKIAQEDTPSVSPCTLIPLGPAPARRLRGRTTSSALHLPQLCT